MKENILEMKGVSKSYDKFTLKDINISLEPGYIMGFIGANGAGKTTTIKLIMNMVKRDSGQIKVFGQDNIKDEVQIKNRIGYVGEQPIFYEDMTVEWTANFARKFYSHWDDETFNELLSQFNLDKSKKVKQLSKGMRMKTALALALSHRPELLILDEPTSGLDPIVRDELLGILMAFIQDDRKSVFFSSHITHDIERVADYVTFIDDGKIILSEEKDDLLNRWKLIKGDISKLDPLKQDLMGIRAYGQGFEALTKDIDVFVKHNDTTGLVIDHASLDDILLHLAKRGN
jgi:ABC-2 type transport system ATP-binding protein